MLLNKLTSHERRLPPDIVLESLGFPYGRNHARAFQTEFVQRFISSLSQARKPQGLLPLG